MKTIFNIHVPEKGIEEQLQKNIDFKTKPLGALGRLEKIALQVGCIQQTTSPELQNPHIIVFAGDHGIANEGVSAYPQEVTHQMVLNFLANGAAINVFTKQHDIALTIVDAGVNHDFSAFMDSRFRSEKIAYGTKSFLKEAAMTSLECEQAILKGAEIVDEIHQVGCNVIGFGEMGISNTSAAALIMSSILNIPLEDCIGKGTGLDDHGLNHKLDVLNVAQANHSMELKNPFDILKTFGGFEMAMMCGAFLKAAELKMTILVDGFIASAAFLCAHSMYNEIIHYAIFCHESNEHGHKQLLTLLNTAPILSVDMRLGEGTGCALAYPILQSSLAFLNEMSSFKDAGVSNKES